ncbi:MAG: type I restriction enzyme HsdR N-terminal domain-containing protein [Bacteroidales bacterium]|nr:type I restriction enzyme HsdR N-terminal domain-containing protein [Bacteroidales bacterium]
MESDYIWDPLRKKSVRCTPEEEVRQWFISVLHEGMKVPEHMMGSEVAFKHGAKEYRADIVVYDRTASPMMIVECKRPDVTLDQEVVDQALRYNNELNVKYIVITNGHKTFMFERQADGFAFMQKAPLWEEMLAKGNYF